MEMKTSCERCSKELNHQSDAYICSYECTYCTNCYQDMNAICPNCSGELVRRPKRELKP